MLRNTTETYVSESVGQAQKARRDPSLAIVLWSLWTLAVVGTAFWHWYSDIVAQQPVNMLGLVIYSILTGMIGMVVLTMVEFRLDPLRFLD